MARRIPYLATLLLVTTVALVGLAMPAAAASLTQVTGFGSNPGTLVMYSYRPDGLPQRAPVVVAFHGCGQTATEYFTNSGWRKYADLWRFALVLPQTTSANNSSACFNWFEPGDQARGQGEALSVKQMVDHAVAAQGADPARVFVTGLSAGGAMTAVMLAAYPDVFRGGAVIAGLAYKCATTLTVGVLCLNQRQNRTPRQWGDLVRGAYPGYTGARPPVQIWYGGSDYTVATFNADQLRDQWTDVHGAAQTPTGSQTLPANTVRDDYGPRVQVYRVNGIGHGTPVDPGSGTDQCGSTGGFFLDSICSSYHIGRSWGLDGGTTPPPTTPSAWASSSSSAPPAPVCVRASNWAHVQAGRAHDELGRTYANGSNQAMGLTNVFTTHTLRQTGPNFWILSDSGC